MILTIFLTSSLSISLIFPSPEFKEQLNLLSKGYCLHACNAFRSKAHDCNYIELQCIMKHYATSGYFRAAMETLCCMRNIAGKPTVYDYNALIYCYLRSQNASSHKLMHLYLEMKRFGPFPNALTFNTLLNGLLALNNLTNAFLVAKEMHCSGFVPSFSSLSRILKKMIYSGHIIDSLNVFDFMMQLKYYPTEHTVTYLFSMLGKAGMIQQVHFVFSTLLGEGFFCGMHNYNKVLWAMCKSGQSYTALQLFYSMKKKGIIHDVCSYTALVYGFSKEGLCEDLFRWLDDMESDGCKPNVITYTIFIKFLCDDGRIELALEFLDGMRNRGCEPDLTTYNVILRELCHQDREHDVLELIEEMDQKGYHPSPHTYAALFGGLLKIGKSQGRLQEMIYLLKIMMDRGLSPTIVSFNTFLKGFCQKHSLEEAFELLDHFAWIDNKPDSVSLNIILSAACKQGNSSIIQKVLSHMEYEGIRLNTIGATCLIQYFCKMGRFDECLVLLKLMLHNGPSPSIITYNILIRASIKKNNTLLLSQLFKDMYSQKLKPDLITYGSLIRGLCKEGKMPIVLRIRKQMLENGIIPSMAIYNAILRAMFQRGKFLDIIWLLKVMAMEGCQPDKITMEILKVSTSKGWLKRFPELYIRCLGDHKFACPVRTFEVQSVIVAFSHSPYMSIAVHTPVLFVLSFPLEDPSPFHERIVPFVLNSSGQSEIL
ncbi:pentatricopeptide repeat-containing protein [Senna tora]|uniref:Pentatricopeptide repeat-containing protein n=1 Tax=Senna tora TaxID=362788 RepID=A0A834WE05_9FABA|nr:pentatricopeptide repeat-containing protein [Senna tora]